MKPIVYLCTLSSALLLFGCNRDSANSGSASDNQAISSGSSSSGSLTSRPQADTSTSADNTGTNVRDRSDATLTPGDQGESQSDLELTRKIRRQITSNDQLSSEAKNIKIITKDGKVTLRGPVNNATEKRTIASIAQQVANGTIDDQLEVKAANQ